MRQLVNVDQLEACHPFISAEKLERLSSFDPLRYKPIEVVERGGRLFVLDGHTRTAAANIAGIQQLEADVHPLTEEQRAGLEFNARLYAQILGLSGGMLPVVDVPLSCQSFIERLKLWVDGA